MKAFLTALVAGALLSYGASVYLGQAGFSAKEQFSLDSVRLGD